MTPNASGPSRSQPAPTSTPGDGPRVGTIFGEGVYDARGVVLPLEADKFAAMLPRGLTLAPQTLTPVGTHPVTLLFGRHTNVRPNLLAVRGGAYREFLLAVPFLRRMTGGNGPGLLVAFMPRLYLSSWLFVFLGWLYAYPKWRARIDDDEVRYTVRSLLFRRPRIEGRFSGPGPQGPIGGFPHFAPLMPVFGEPFAQRFWCTPWICSVMQFDLARASVSAVSGNVCIASAFVPGLPVGSFEFEGIDSGPLGAFHIEVPWRLSLPVRCDGARRSGESATAIRSGGNA